MKPRLLAVWKYQGKTSSCNLMLWKGVWILSLLYYESGEVLEQLPREAVDAPSIPGGVQGQVGWGPGQPDLVNGEVGGPAWQGGGDLGSLRSLPARAILWFCDLIRENRLKWVKEEFNMMFCFHFQCPFSVLCWFLLVVVYVCEQRCWGSVPYHHARGAGIPTWERGLTMGN